MKKTEINKYANIYVEALVKEMLKNEFIQLKDKYTKDDVIKELYQSQKTHGSFVRSVYVPSSTRRLKSNWTIDNPIFSYIEPKKMQESTVSGHPWLKDSEEWPKCKTCGTPHKLAYQLNLSHLTQDTGKRFGKGLLQLFICPKYQAEGRCDDGGKYVRNNVDDGLFVKKVAFPAVLIRNIIPNGSPKIYSIPEPWLHDYEDYEIDDMVSSIKLGSYTHSHYQPADYMDLDEMEVVESMEKYFINVGEGECGVNTDLGEILIEVADDVEKKVTPRGKRFKKYRIGGWPSWNQREDYPECPVCNNLMRNLTYEDDLVCVSRLFQCQKHLERFAWWFDR